MSAQAAVTQVNSASTGSAVDIDEPYLKIVREIKHWCSVPASNYRQMIKHQLLRAYAVKATRTRLSQKLNLQAIKNKIRTEHDWLAIAALVSNGEISRPQPMAVPRSGCGTNGGAFAWGTDFGGGTVEANKIPVGAGDSMHEMDDEDALMEHMAGLAPRAAPRTLPEFPDSLPQTEWSSEDILIRSAEQSRGKKRSRMAGKLKSYTHEQSASLSPEFIDSLVAESYEAAQMIKHTAPFALGDLLQGIKEVSMKDNK